VLIRTRRGFLRGEEMSAPRLVRCQKCGKPLGYVTVLAEGLAFSPLPVQDVKLVAICMECFQTKE
jgi:hypothetical protein